MANEAAAEAVSKENDRIGLELSFRPGGQSEAPADLITSGGFQVSSP
jgi:hypothetical protein